MRLFAKLPSWWVREQNRSYFPAGKHAGESIAALKCLLALSLRLEFHTLLVEKLSITNIEDLTGLSRPMVLKGLKHLESIKLIEIIKENHTHSYRLSKNLEDEGWAKVPYKQVISVLPLLSNRGPVALDTLKTYIYLLSRRPNKSITVSIPYEVILKYTNGQRSNLRKAIDILISHALIKCDKAIDMKAQNVYTIIGTLT